ncbi:MAG TPA: hypothetical protein VF933_15265 [Streptosporangiaceae bacterium]
MAEEQQPGTGAVELGRVVPPSGNLQVAGQQIWLGPAMTGRTARIWAGTRQVHVLADGYRIKTLPSRLDATDLARLAAAGATPAGPPPLPPPGGSVIEIERTVSASGNVSVGNHVISAGSPLAGRRVTVRLDGPVAHILSGGILVRTVACPVPEAARHRLRGARAAAVQPPRLPDQLTVKRRVSVRGAIMIGGQRIQIGLPHPGQDRGGHRRGGHLPDRRGGRHCRRRAAQDQPRHQPPQGLRLRLT